MSISYEEVREIMGREPNNAVISPYPKIEWYLSSCTIIYYDGRFVPPQWDIQTPQGQLISRGHDTTQLRHLLTGLGVREWDGGEDQGDSIPDLLRRLRELCAAISGDSQEEAILRIDDEGTWSAECHAIDGRGPTPEAACRAAIREARASLSARANQLESRAATLRRLAEGGR